MLSVALSLSFSERDSRGAASGSDGGRYPPPCPVEPGLSSPWRLPAKAGSRIRQRPSGRPTDLIHYMTDTPFSRAVRLDGRRRGPEDRDKERANRRMAIYTIPWLDLPPDACRGE